MRVRQVVSLLCSAVMLAALTQTLRAQQAVSPDDKESRAYALTLDKSERVATTALTMRQMSDKDAALSAAMDAAMGSPSPKPFTEAAQNIDSKLPTIVAVIRQNGFSSTRDFLVAMFALLSDYTLVDLKKAGKIPDYPPGMITPENAKLIECNWPAFQAIYAKMAG